MVIAPVDIVRVHRHLDKQERFLNEIADRAAAHGEITAEEAEGRRVPSEKKEGRSAPGI